MSKGTSSLYLIGGPATANGQTLTTSYATGTAGKTIDISGYDQMIISANYVPGENAKNAFLQVQFSWDGGTTWNTESIGSDSAVASNTITTTVYDREYKWTGATASTVYPRRIPIAIGDVGIFKGVLCRVLVKEDSAAPQGTISVLVNLYKQTH